MVLTRASTDNDFAALACRRALHTGGRRTSKPAAMTTIPAIALAVSLTKRLRVSICSSFPTTRLITPDHTRME